MNGLRAVFFGLALIPGAAAAMTPILECYGDATGTAAEIGSYNPSRLGNGFTFYSSFETRSDVVIAILEYCPDRRQAVLRTGLPGSESARDEAARVYFEEMIWGQDGYTQRQMVQRLRDIGADAELRTVNYESCACALQ